MKKDSKFVFLLCILVLFVIPCGLMLNGFDRGQEFIGPDVYDISLNISGTGTIEMCNNYAYHYPGYAGVGDIITFDFSTEPNHLIGVWLMDNEQFNHFHDTNDLVGDWLVTSVSGAGICFPQYESKWHIVFLHDEFQCTTLTYNVTFSPYITIIYVSLISLIGI